MVGAAGRGGGGEIKFIWGTPSAMAFLKLRGCRGL